MDFNAISLPRKMLAGAGLLLLLDSFLPWYQLDVGLASGSASGWHQIGPVAFIFLIITLAIEGTRAFGVLPLDDAKADLATLAAATLTLLFGIILLIQGSPSFWSLDFGYWIGLILLVALAGAGYLLFKDSDAMATLKSIQANQNKGDATPPAPPAS